MANSDDHGIWKDERLERRCRFCGQTMRHHIAAKNYDGGSEYLCATPRFEAVEQPRPGSTFKHSPTKADECSTCGLPSTAHGYDYIRGSHNLCPDPSQWPPRFKDKPRFIEIEKLSDADLCTRFCAGEVLRNAEEAERICEYVVKGLIQNIPKNGIRYWEVKVVTL